ncbi:MAG: hypothetical protein ABSB22_12480 [Thermodesulfobacteriota bacterium]|jgi:hypothetical protein
MAREYGKIIGRGGDGEIERKRREKAVNKRRTTDMLSHRSTPAFAKPASAAVRRSAHKCGHDQFVRIGRITAPTFDSEFEKTCRGYLPT